MTNYDKLLGVNEKTRHNIELLNTSGKFEEINKCIIFTEDLNEWVSYCENFAEIFLVKEAQDECVKSIYLCTQGLYKESIISLRQFLEHILFAVLLSTNDYMHRLWRLGKCDMSWSRIVDEQNGVFGKEFIKVYAKDVNEERSIELLTVVKNVYRECSEFVHGNFEKLINSSGGIDYDEELLNKYLDYFSSIKYVVSMALLIRFWEILDNRDTVEHLEMIIMENVGTMSEVQYLYSLEDK